MVVMNESHLVDLYEHWGIEFKDGVYKGSLNDSIYYAELGIDDSTTVPHLMTMWVEQVQQGDTRMLRKQWYNDVNSSFVEWVLLIVCFLVLCCVFVGAVEESNNKRYKMESNDSLEYLDGIEDNYYD